MKLYEIAVGFLAGFVLMTIFLNVRDGNLNLKRWLFWVVTPITIPIVIVAGIVESIGFAINEGLAKFEGWCFEYRKQGLVRRDGFWTLPH